MALFHQYAIDSFDSGANLQSRSVALVRAVEKGASPDGTIDEVTIALIEATIENADSSIDDMKRLSAALATDGYALVGKRVTPVVPVAVSAPLQPSKVEALLGSVGAIEALNHYQQAVATFADAQYEAANSQCRSALESFLKHVATTKVKNAADPIAAIQALRAAQLISDKEQAYLKAVWSLLHDGGSHAGTTSADEALFRLTMISLAIWFLSARVAVIGI